MRQRLRQDHEVRPAEHAGGSTVVPQRSLAAVLRFVGTNKRTGMPLRVQNLGSRWWR